MNPPKARQISREEWVNRYGSERGIKGWRPEDIEAWLSDAYERSTERLGRGAYGEVRVHADRPDVAIKQQAAARSVTGGLPVEVDIQARLGNELGLMPALTHVEMPPKGAPLRTSKMYIGQENLAEQGYQTLGKAGLDKLNEAKAYAEQYLNEAWAARAGIKVRDSHEGNVMVLRPELPPAEDGSRVKLIDPGLYTRLPDRDEQLRAQGVSLFMGYSNIGLGDMGEQLNGLVRELVARGETRIAEQVVADGLSDLAQRAESLTQRQLMLNRAVDSEVRFAGGAIDAALRDGVLQMPNHIPMVSPAEPPEPPPTFLRGTTWRELGLRPELGTMPSFQ